MITFTPRFMKHLEIFFLAPQSMSNTVFEEDLFPSIMIFLVETFETRFSSLGSEIFIFLFITIFPSITPRSLIFCVRNLVSEITRAGTFDFFNQLDSVCLL